MLSFENGDEINTTLGNGIFQRYSNGGQSYFVLFTDGNLVGQQLSIGPKAILSNGRSVGKSKTINSIYAPYIGNELIFDKPIDFNKNPSLMETFLKQSHMWILIVSSSPDSILLAEEELSQAGLINASDYIRKSSDTTHGIKYDLLIPDPKIPNIDIDLGIYFNPIRLSSTNRYQIGRKDFILRCIPYIRVLEIGESI